ncbi:hypothetical protein RB653_005323 [Dictyostelium firmibasis]|uniref:Uncharacterized protein n=1 Tax=Dictyostelium firmibasis TaxID=79012 RepID=A0AAN7UCD9_9MYCE
MNINNGSNSTNNGNNINDSNNFQETSTSNFSNNPTSMRFVLRSKSPSSSNQNESRPFKIDQNDNIDDSVIGYNDSSSSSNSSNSRHPIYSLTNQPTAQPSSSSSSSASYMSESGEDFLKYIDNKLEQLEKESQLQTSYAYNFNNNNNNKMNYNNNLNFNSPPKINNNGKPTNSTPSPSQQQQRQQTNNNQQQKEQEQQLNSTRRLPSNIMYQSPIKSTETNATSSNNIIKIPQNQQQRNQTIIANLNFVNESIGREIEELERVLNWHTINSTNERDITSIKYQIKLKYNQIQKLNEIGNLI